MKIRLLALALAPALIAGAAAQDSGPHFTSMKGKVTIRHGDSGPWIAATPGARLAAGDRIATASNGRAEVRLDSANLLQLGGNAEIRLAQVEDVRYRIELAAGGVIYQVVAPSTAAVAVDTPNISLATAQEGVYRILVKPDQSEIAPQAGEIEAFAPSGSQWVTAGQKMLVRGAAANPEFRIMSAGRFWRRLARLAGIFRNMQIGVDAATGSSGDDSSTAAKKKSDQAKASPSTKPNERTPRHTPAYRGGSQHVDTGASPRGNEQASRGSESHGSSHQAPAAHSNGGSHSAPAAHADSGSHAAASHSNGGSHSAPAAHADSGSHAAASHSDGGSHSAAASSSHSDGGSHAAASSSNSTSSSGHK
jgi:hypothetical protein